MQQNNLDIAVRIPRDPPSCFALCATQDWPYAWIEAGCPPTPQRSRAGSMAPMPARS